MYTKSSDFFLFEETRKKGHIIQKNVMFVSPIGISTYLRFSFKKMSPSYHKSKSSFVCLIRKYIVNNKINMTIFVVWWTTDSDPVFYRIQIRVTQKDRILQQTTLKARLLKLKVMTKN